MRTPPVLPHFLHDETGSATIDWAILTCVLIVVGNLMFEPVAEATQKMANGIAAQLSGMQIPMTFDDYRRLR